MIAAIIPDQNIMQKLQPKGLGKNSGGLRQNQRQFTTWYRT